MRLIDAEQLKHKINNSELYGTKEWENVLDMAFDCETVDAVPVVRCQNCRCWKQHTAVDIEGNLVYLDSGNCGVRVTNKDDYCSLAVRREETE